MQKGKDIIEEDLEVNLYTMQQNTKSTEIWRDSIKDKEMERPDVRHNKGVQMVLVIKGEINGDYTTN